MPGTATTRRATTALAAVLLCLTLAGPPAAALRLVPVDPPAPASDQTRPVHEPSMCMSLGKLAAHPTGERLQPQPGHTDENSSHHDSPIMTLGRLPK